MTTVEAAFLVPLVLLVICCLLTYHVQLFSSAEEEIKALYEETKEEVRMPTAVIRNTDLFLSFFKEEKKS